MCTADRCDPASGCQYSPLPSGTSCGDASGGTCDHPDTCDGSGQCQANTEPDGTTCDDGNPCTTDDRCSGGICIGCPPSPSCSQCNGGVLFDDFNRADSDVVGNGWTEHGANSLIRNDELIQTGEDQPAVFKQTTCDNLASASSVSMSFKVRLPSDNRTFYAGLFSDSSAPLNQWYNMTGIGIERTPELLIRCNGVISASTHAYAFAPDTDYYAWVDYKPHGGTMAVKAYVNTTPEKPYDPLLSVDYCPYDTAGHEAILAVDYAAHPGAEWRYDDVKVCANCDDGDPCTMDSCNAGGGCRNTPVPGCPATVFFDDFNRPDGPVYNGWTTDSLAAIVGNHLRLGELSGSDPPGISRSIGVNYPIEIAGVANGFQDPNPNDPTQNSYVIFNGLGIAWMGGASGPPNSHVWIRRLNQWQWVDTGFNAYDARGHFYFWIDIHGNDHDYSVDVFLSTQPTKPAAPTASGTTADVRGNTALEMVGGRGYTYYDDIRVGSLSCATNSDCGDGNPCTTDSCDPTAARCVHTPISGCCQAAGLRFYNVDDVLDAFMTNADYSSVPVLSAGFMQDTGVVDITPFTRSGGNSLLLRLTNGGSGWTYGYQFLIDSAIREQDACGTVNVFGCNGNDQTSGVVWTHTISFDNCVP